MAREYALLLDESVYAEMVKDAYDAPPWMARQSVRSKATQLPRSKKKLDELCKKKAIREGDTFTMMKTSTSGAAIVFSATVGSNSSVLPSGANTGFNLTD